MCLKCESGSSRFQPGEGLVGAFSVIMNLRMELFESLVEGNHDTLIQVFRGAGAWLLRGC